MDPPKLPLPPLVTGNPRAGMVKASQPKRGDEIKRQKAAGRFPAAPKPRSMSFDQVLKIAQARSDEIARLKQIKTEKGNAR